MKDRQQVEKYLKELQKFTTNSEIKDIPINDLLARLSILSWILED
jgi:hypothetical protein